MPFLTNLLGLGKYAWEYQRYAEELCENKDRPEMACNGTCQLAKLLQVEEEPSSEPQMPVVQQYDWLFWEASEITHKHRTLANYQRPFSIESAHKGFAQNNIPPPRLGFV